MTGIATRRGDAPAAAAVGAHQVQRLLAAGIRGVDQEAPVRAPARVLQIAGAESQAAFVATVGADGVDVEPSPFLTGKGDPVP